MSGDQIILAVWAFGVVLTWPFFAVAVWRSDDMLGGDRKPFAEMSGFEQGFAIWWPLLCCTMAWPLILTTLVIAKVVKRVTR